MQQITLEDIRKAILSLGKELKEAEAIGAFGSLVRENEFTDHSDIDIFVVVKEKEKETDLLWFKKVKDVLSEFERDVTVLVYSIKGLKEINNWYVFRLASEGVLFYDKGNIKKLFIQILKVAKESGLERVKIGESLVWAKKEINWGERFEVKV